ncbi:MAG: hypothetical protein CBB71_04170 [Rhodopirellula sp. TMED11]|nr:MAG: hypothetical protein CBB71_04170 [Rhodopirellula sp. TMED11]
MLPAAPSSIDLNLPVPFQGELAASDAGQGSSQRVSLSQPRNRPSGLTAGRRFIMLIKRLWLGGPLRAKKPSGVALPQQAGVWRLNRGDKRTW